MILDWGVHLIDQMLGIIYDKKIKSIYCRCFHITNYEVDDGFRLELYFEDGPTALIEVGTSNFIKLPRWVVEGVDGTAVVEDFQKNGKIVCACGEDDKNVVPVETAAGLTKTMAPRRPETIHTLPLPQLESDVRDFYRNVIAHLNGQADSIVTLPQVARVMRLMEAVRESAKIGQVVAFEE
jgi:predicted dehydrogenase